MRRTFTTLALLVLLAPSARSQPGGVQFRAAVDTLRADENLTWILPLVIRNDGTRGLYVDSLWLEARDGGGPVQRFDFQPLIKGMRAISVGDSNELRLSAPASLERGRAQLRLSAHDGDGQRLTAALEFAIAAGVLDAHVSRLTQVNGRAIEWVRVAAEPSAAPATGAPGVVLVHGHGGSARAMLRMARSLSEQGMAVVCVSLPGYGASEGPPDFMGPASVRAVTLALDSLAASAGVDRRHLAIWGVSRGATVALLTAAQRPDVAAVVAQSGVYDLWSVHRATLGTELGGNLLREAGRDSAAWKARSPLLSAVTAKASVLVVHGDHDEVAPVADARDFAARRRALGLPVREQVLAGQKHQLPRPAVNRAALAFLRESLGLTGP